ncbi:MAG: response regulator transcription factor [Lachnospiraceae bacterium]
MTDKILIIEDDDDIRTMIYEALNQPDYDIQLAQDGREALKLFQETSDLNLVILDLMLPQIDGLTVLKKIRETNTVPVIILSARNGEYEKVLGLEYGADDYITKPFSVIELQARVKAALRRNKQYQLHSSLGVGQCLKVGQLTIELDNFVVKKEQEVIHVTAREFKLIKLFATHPEKVFTKVQLYKEIWDDQFLNDENVVNVTIRRLREKIEDDPSDPQYIQTIWGIGYKLGVKS